MKVNKSKQSEQIENTQNPNFGDYASIEMKRYNIPNEIYSHKVIGAFRSNMWVEVPVQSPAREVYHAEMEDVVNCICCGVDETDVKRYRVKDIKIIKSL